MKVLNKTTFIRPFQLPVLHRDTSSRTVRDMAWACSALTNDGLVDNLVKNSLVKIPRVEQVMRLVDRRAFLPSRTPPEYAYADSPHPLPCAATISAPHMHAMALELLNEYLTPKASALDIGAGSGYFAACMAALVGPQGKVVAIEHAPTLSEFARKNLDRFAADVPEDRACPVVVRTGDGRLGDSEAAPFKAIHVGAAAPIVPHALVSQLAPDGAMVIPIGEPHGSQRLAMVTKDKAGQVSERTICYVRYVPLCDLQQQMGDASSDM